MGTLNLFPARVPIGRVMDPGGQRDVMMTAEFSRALAALFDRVGGADSIGLSDVGKMIDDIQADLARRPSVLAQAAPGATLTGTAIESVLATITVPAKAMGRNGMLRISTAWSLTNSENEKKIVLRFGGVVMSSDTVITTSRYQTQQSIQNKGDFDSQVFVFGGAAYTGMPVSTMGKDTTAPQDIEIVAQLSSSGETITLEAYTVELIPFA